MRVRGPNQMRRGAGGTRVFGAAKHAPKTAKHTLSEVWAALSVELWSRRESYGTSADAT